MSRWEKVRARAAEDPEVLEVVLATLEEAKKRIQDARPAATSKLTFRGGKVRSVGMLRKMAEECR